MIKFLPIPASPIVRGALGSFVPFVSSVIVSASVRMRHSKKLFIHSSSVVGLARLVLCNSERCCFVDAIYFPRHELSFCLITRKFNGILFCRAFHARHHKFPFRES